jgi:DNA-binding protein
MSISGMIFASIVAIKIIKAFLDGLTDSTAPINEGEEVRVKASIKYISNGVELNESIRRHYYKVLDMHSSPIIHDGIVFEQYQKHLQYTKEDELLGYKVKYSVRELKAAEYYLYDLCEYYGNLN